MRVDEKRTFLAGIAGTFMEADALPLLWAGSLALQRGQCRGLGWPWSSCDKGRLCKSAMGSAQNVATAPLVSLGLDKK